MPVRIRLAYHPLARKKEPLYHIVAAKSKTGRQRKPLEVLGVYDPIPRHPTTPTGEVLEDKPKIKKISMNMDRVRYWLSVGAQPSDHCSRLLTKANLIPEKPAFKDRSVKVNIPAESVSSQIKGWGRPDQGVSNLLNESEPTPSSRKVLPAVIAPTGQHIESEIRKVSRDLVSSVLKESRYEENPINIHQPDFHKPYVTARRKDLMKILQKWLARFGREWKTVFNVRFNERSSHIALRFFMAYFQPLKGRSEEYNLARLRFFKEWMIVTGFIYPTEIKVIPREERVKEDEFQKIWDGNLFEALQTVFNTWEECAVRLEGKQEWGKEEKLLGDGIRQRATLLKLARDDKQLREEATKAWNPLWAISQPPKRKSKKKKKAKQRRKAAAAAAA